ncbi:MAG: hypothetical protein MUE51_12665 [Thermoleophilia bacterium]|nr:hypothetical protein [Thermoleophilia bacterium]
MRTAIAGAAAALAVAAAPALGHAPRFLETPAGRPVVLALPDGTLSVAAYGRTTRAGETRTLRARLAAGDTLRVEVLVPDRPPERGRAAGRRPQAAVITPSGTRIGVPPASGRFSEPVSRTRYLTVARLRRPAPESGVYRVALRTPRPGRLVVAVGEREAFTARDLAALPRAIARIRAWAARRRDPQTPKLSPQEQVDVAFGLRILNPRRSSVRS